MSENKVKGKRIIINIERRTLKIIFILNGVIFIGSFLLGFLIGGNFSTGADKKIVLSDAGITEPVKIVSAPVSKTPEIQESVSKQEKEEVVSPTPAAPPRQQVSPPAAVQPSAPVAPKPLPTPAASPQRRYTIQVISLRDYNEAINVRDNLRRFGLDARVVEVQLSTGKWYRIRIGTYATENEAKIEAKKIEDKGIINSFMIWQE